MGTEKRARQKANRALKREQEVKVEQKEQRRHYLVVGVLAAAALGAVLFFLSLGGDDDGDDVAADDSAQSETTQTTLDASVLAEPAVVAPGPGEAIDGTPECPEPDGSSERTTSFTEAPPLCIDPTATYTAEFDTTAGTIEATLDAEQAPDTVNNFVFLARYHYYDGVPFHRIIPGFVIQGGDPVGEPLGFGGPGYTIAEEAPEAGAYEVGSLAMAKGPGPGSTGGQFFFVTGEAGAGLPPEYSLFGSITDGLDVALDIEGLPTNGEDYPIEEIYINSVTITES